MKFKFKTLITAVALATSAASANAAIEIGSTTGGSELVFSAWDSVAGVGYTYDLLSSLKLESFIGADAAANATGNVTMLANAVVSNSLITGPNGQILDVALTGFPFTSNIANVEWNLNAVDFTGRNRLLTTKDITDVNPFSNNSNQVRAAATGMNSYYSQANAFAVDANEDTYSLTVAADGAAYAGNYGSGWVNNLGDTTNVMGAQSFVFLAAQPTQSSSAVAGLFKQMATANGENLVVSTYQQGSQWRLRLSVEQTAPIPEPETYAMFLAGLGMMGAVARRRKSQVK